MDSPDIVVGIDFGMTVGNLETYEPAALLTDPTVYGSGILHGTDLVIARNNSTLARQTRQ